MASSIAIGWTVRVQRAGQLDGAAYVTIQLLTHVVSVAGLNTKPLLLHKEPPKTVRNLA